MVLGFNNYLKINYINTLKGITMKGLYDKQEYFEKMDRYFDAVNYLSVAQLYLLKNPLMRKPLSK